MKGTLPWRRLLTEVVEGLLVDRMQQTGLFGSAERAKRFPSIDKIKLGFEAVLGILPQSARIEARPFRLYPLGLSTQRRKGG